MCFFFFSGSLRTFCEKIIVFRTSGSPNVCFGRAQRCPGYLPPPFFATGFAPRTPKHPFVATCPPRLSATYTPAIYQRASQRMSAAIKACWVFARFKRTGENTVRWSTRQRKNETKVFGTTNLSHPFPEEICASERPLQRCRKVLYGQSGSPFWTRMALTPFSNSTRRASDWARAVLRRQLAPRRRMAAAWRRQIHATKKSYDKHARWRMSAPARNGSVNQFLTLSVRQSGALVRRVPGESRIRLLLRVSGFRHATWPEVEAPSKRPNEGAWRVSIAAEGPLAVVEAPPRGPRRERVVAGVQEGARCGEASVLAVHIFLSGQGRMLSHRSRLRRSRGHHGRPKTHFLDASLA